MDEEFDSGMGFMDDDVEIDESMDDEGFDEDEHEEDFHGEPEANKKKYIIIGIVSIVVTIALVIGGVALLGSGGNDDGVNMTQEEIQQKIDEAYTKGVNDTKGDYETQLADKNQEISDLSSQMRRKADEANNNQSRADEAANNQQAILEEAQDAIDDIARERDMWRERAEKAEREQ